MVGGSRRPTAPGSSHTADPHTDAAACQLPSPGKRQRLPVTSPSIYVWVGMHGHKDYYKKRPLMPGLASLCLIGFMSSSKSYTSGTAAREQHNPRQRHTMQCPAVHGSSSRARSTQQMRARCNAWTSTTPHDAETMHTDNTHARTHTHAHTRTHTRTHKQTQYCTRNSATCATV